MVGAASRPPPLTSERTIPPTRKRRGRPQASGSPPPCRLQTTFYRPGRCFNGGRRGSRPSRRQPAKSGCCTNSSSVEVWLSRYTALCTNFCSSTGCTRTSFSTSPSSSPFVNTSTGCTRTSELFRYYFQVKVEKNGDDICNLGGSNLQLQPVSDYFKITLAKSVCEWHKVCFYSSGLTKICRPSSMRHPSVSNPGSR